MNVAVAASDDMNSENPFLEESAEWWLAWAVEEMNDLDSTRSAFSGRSERSKAVGVARRIIELARISRRSNEPNARFFKAAEATWSGSRDEVASHLYMDFGRLDEDSRNHWDQLIELLGKHKYREACDLVEQWKRPAVVVDMLSCETVVAACCLHVKSLAEAGKHAEATEFASMVSQHLPPFVNANGKVLDNRERVRRYLIRTQLILGKPEEAIETAYSEPHIMANSVFDFIDAQSFVKARQLLDTSVENGSSVAIHRFPRLAEAQANATLHDQAEQTADAARIVVEKHEESQSMAIRHYAALANIYHEIGAVGKANACLDEVVKRWEHVGNSRFVVWPSVVTLQARLNRLQSGIPLPELEADKGVKSSFVIGNCLIARVESERGQQEQAVERLTTIREQVLQQEKHDYLLQQLAAAYVEIGESRALQAWIDQQTNPRHRVNALLGAAMGTLVKNGFITRTPTSPTFLRRSQF